MTVKTDKQVVNDIFKALRKEGFIARQSYKCCGEHGWDGMVKEYNADEDSKIVFYHMQDAEAFDDSQELTHTLFLAWQGDGEQIVSIIKQHGYEVDWTGEKDYRIGIKPKVAEQV